jgi:hypothetical protein
MSNQNQSKQSFTQAEPIGALGCLVRIVWLMGGNLALFMLAVFIFHQGMFSVLDVAFWAIVAGLILIRYLDIARLKGLTSSSEPATLRHWRMYVIKLLVASAGLWGLAHGIPYLGNR